MLVSCYTAALMKKPKGSKISNDLVAIVLPSFGLAGTEGKSTSLCSSDFIAKGEVELNLQSLS